jgi:hypothetical protein
MMRFGRAAQKECEGEAKLPRERANEALAKNKLPVLNLRGNFALIRGSLSTMMAQDMAAEGLFS